MSRIYGRHAIEELLSTSPEAITTIWVADATGSASEQTLMALAEQHNIPVRQATPDDLRGRAGGRGGARIGADVRILEAPDLGDIEGKPGVPCLLLALDGVTDPHNLGAIMRSAAAFGARAVITTKERSAPLNDAAVRASAGAVAHIPLLRVTNLARALRQLTTQGFWVLGTDLDHGQSLWESDLAGPVVVVMGAEGRGLRPGVAKACDDLIRLPMPGPLSSLNVSVFGGIACAEFARQTGQVTP